MAGIKKVRKRDGTIVDFDQERITNAIFKAAQAVGGKDRKLAKRLAGEITKVLEQKFVDKIPGVEDIQDVVEKVLIEEGHARTAKAYILYRRYRGDLRKLREAWISCTELIDSYLEDKEWRIRENANVGRSMAGLIFHASNTVLANYALSKVYPPEIADAHRNGDFHLHDLQLALQGYCVKPSTLILGDNKMISEYKPTDFAFGLSGKQNVTEVFRREFSGKLIRLRACGTLPIEITPEHPVLTVLGGWSGGVFKLRTPQWLPASMVEPHIGRNKRFYIVIPRLSGTESKEVLDLTPFAKRKESLKVKRLPLSETTAWLLGLYVAEGYGYTGMSECRTRFCVGKGEIELIREVENALKSLGLHYRKINLKTGLHIELRYFALARALKEWCGGKATVKRIPEFILLHVKREILEAFLEGYVAGDGSIEKKEKEGKSWYGKRTRMWSVSALLALQLQLLCARLGIFSSISQDKRESRGRIQGRKVRGQNVFEISFYSKGAKYAKILNNVILTPVRKKEAVDYKGYVHNI